MNAILGLSDLMRKMPLEGKSKEYVKIIHQSASNLLVILNDILDLSKLEAGKVALENIDFSLKEISETVMATLDVKAKEKNLEFYYVLDDKLPEFVSGDPSRLSQVLINLLGNALKFTDKGSVHFEMAKSKSNEQGISVEFSVHDTGIGIAPEKLDSIFESFTQENSATSRKYGGTGLGLTISKQLVELQGGKIIVSSEQGRGSQFKFELFYQNAQQRSQNTETEVLNGDFLIGKKILLADDNEFNQMVAVDTIESFCNQVMVTTALNGIEVLKSLEKDPFDLLLLDVQMPEMDGYETARQIRNHLKMNSQVLPIVAMTANASQNDIEQCKQAGMDNFVPKPFTSEQLLRILFNYLG